MDSRCSSIGSSQSSISSAGIDQFDYDYLFKVVVVGDSGEFPFMGCSGPIGGVTR
jgi:hypothetical protein